MMRPSQACINMIKQQLRTNNINNETILALYNYYPRENFLPEHYQAFAYVDMHIPIDENQVMLTPLEEAKVLQSGQFKPEDHVLIFGSGHTYLIGLLSHLCEKVQVMDTSADQIVAAKKCFKKHKINNVDLMVCESYDPKKTSQGFDAIICPAAVSQVPTSWFNFLKPNGKLFVSLGEEVQHAQWLHLNAQKVTGHEFVFSTHLPRLPKLQVESKFIF